MSFTSLVRQVTKQPTTINIPSSWGQGRASFGGVVAALVYQSMQQQLESDAPVRSLQISFVGPISDEDFIVESEVLRQGKSVAQVMGRGRQSGGTQIAMLGSFGHGRDSVIEVADEPMKFPENPFDLEPMPFIPGATPEFTKFFDFRYCTGIPFSASPGRSLRGFVRFQDEPEIGIPQLLGLVDAWPPAVLPMLSKPAPASSLNWNIEFLQPYKAMRPDEFCQYQADIEFAHDGYACTRAKVWNEAGELIATSQQTVVAFA